MKRQQIDKDDRADLVAYFSGVAFARLSASSMGPALERASRFGGSRPCPGCGGVGRLDGTREMRERSEKLARRRRVVTAEVVTGQHPAAVPKERIPHLTEYRARLEAAALAGPDLSAAHAYAEAHRKELLAELRVERRRTRKFRITQGKRRGKKSRESSVHLREWRSLMAVAVADVATFASAERYRREHANQIHDELMVETLAIGAVEVVELESEIAVVRREEKVDPLSTWCPACAGKGIVGCESAGGDVVWDPEWIDAHPKEYWIGCSMARRVGGADEQAERPEMHVHETRVSLGVELGESEVERLGRVGAHLSRVEALEPTVSHPGELPWIDGEKRVEALLRMHSPGWGVGPAALLTLTPAGRLLVTEERARWRREPTYQQMVDAGAEPTDEQVLDRVRTRQEEDPSVRIGSRLADARRDAEELAADAVQAWNRTGRARNAPSAAKERPQKRFRAPANAELKEISDLVRAALAGSVTP